MENASARQSKIVDLPVERAGWQVRISRDERGPYRKRRAEIERPKEPHPYYDQPFSWENFWRCFFRAQLSARAYGIVIGGVVLLLLSWLYVVMCAALVSGGAAEPPSP